MMLRHFLALLLVCSVVGCAEDKPQHLCVAQVGEKYLTLDQVKNAVPNNLSAEDSTEIASNYIQNWLNNELMFSKAQYNLNDEKQTIEERVEKYRRDLMIFAYEKELVRQKLDTTVSEAEIVQYYNDNEEIFQLNDYILKVRYIKLPINAPDLNKVSAWMKSNEPEDQQQLMDYSHKYATKFYNDTTWVYFNELLKEFPIEVYNKETFLRSGKFSEFIDGEQLYYLAINDIKSKNTISPLDLKRDQIKSLILNKRKIELLNTIRKRIYKDAISSGKATIYAKPVLPN